MAKMEDEYKRLEARYDDLSERQGRGDNVGKALEDVAQAMRETFSGFLPTLGAQGSTAAQASSTLPL